MSQIEGFAKYLKTQGKKVKLDFEAKEGGNGEFFLFLIDNGNKIPIFSNSREKYGDTAVCGFALKEDKYPDIMSKIK